MNEHEMMILDLAVRVWGEMAVRSLLSGEFFQNIFFNDRSYLAAGVYTLGWQGWLN